MGTNFIEPKIIIKLAESFGWEAHPSPKPGSHTVMLKKDGERTVPVRATIKGKIEAQILLKELKIPKASWPEKVK